MRVQTWNLQAEEMWGLRGEEVVGKNFLGLDIGLPIEMLIPHIRAVFGGRVAWRNRNARRQQPPGPRDSV